jgi:hypothetical protein
MTISGPGVITGGGGSALNDPIRNPQTWDVIILAGVQSPGICKLEGFDRDNGWQEKKGKGSVGATLTYVQRPPAKGKIVFTLWTSAHFLGWEQNFRKLFMYNSSATPDQQAVTISHPALDDIQLSQVVTKKISPVRHMGKGKYHVVVELWEYVPTPKTSVVQSVTFANPNPSSTLGPGLGAQQPSAAQKAKQLISSLLAQAQSNP